RSIAGVFAGVFNQLPEGVLEGRRRLDDRLLAERCLDRGLGIAGAGAIDQCPPDPGQIQASPLLLIKHSLEMARGFSGRKQSVDMLLGGLQQ
ncbi:MAG: hypothetical protein ABEH59_10540, partial [Halobacteriales archaeon]